MSVHLGVSQGKTLGWSGGGSTEIATPAGGGYLESGVGLPERRKWYYGGGAAFGMAAGPSLGVSYTF